MHLTSAAVKINKFPKREITQYMNMNILDSVLLSQFMSSNYKLLAYSSQGTMVKTDKEGI